VRERTIGIQRVVYREDKHRPLSQRGMHECRLDSGLEAPTRIELVYEALQASA
jgi:hypothetical protein